MTKESLFEEVSAFFFKVLLPPIIGVSMKLTLKSKKEKITLANGIMSFFTGVGLAWLASPVVFSAIPPNWASIILATVAITGDKFAEFLIDKFDVDLIMKVLVEHFISFLKSLTGK